MGEPPPERLPYFLKYIPILGFWRWVNAEETLKTFEPLL